MPPRAFAGPLGVNQGEGIPPPRDLITSDTPPGSPRSDDDDDLTVSTLASEGFFDANSEEGLLVLAVLRKRACKEEPGGRSIVTLRLRRQCCTKSDYCVSNSTVHTISVAKRV